MLSFVNLKQSKGNFFTDVDGNVVLDLVCSQPLGYNHDVLINARDSELYDRFLQGSVDVSSVPPSDFADLLRDEVMPVAPAGLTQVQLADGSATTANEVALSTAIMLFAMRNRTENYSNLSVLGFTKGAHGNSVATLSCSDTAANPSGLPTYGWPQAPLPKLKYPLAANETANAEEEARCLQATKDIIGQQRADGRDVAAMIVEPVSGVDMLSATPAFYKKLRALAKEEGIPFVVDETRTGMGQSGKMWAHEHWYLQERDGGCPDMVTFGGKAGISGFYSTYDFRLNPHCASFEQNVEMAKLLNFGLTWRHVQKRGLLELVQDSSAFLKIELGNIARDQKTISNVRGVGTAIAFDLPDADLAQSMQSWLLKNGIVVSRVGPTSLGLRPALILGPSHAANLRDVMKCYHVNHDQH